MGILAPSRGTLSPENLPAQEIAENRYQPAEEFRLRMRNMALSSVHRCIEAREFPIGTVLALIVNSDSCAWGKRVCFKRGTRLCS